MQSPKRIGEFVLWSLAAFVLASCTGQKEPAQRLIAEIQSTITAASGEAAKYVPGELQEVQSKFGELQAAYDKKDYPAVVTGAQAVLGAAQSLATDAAAKKDEILKALNDKWTGLAGSVPGYLMAIQTRLEFLGKKANKKAAAGIDTEAAKSRLSDAMSLWSKAQAAFAGGTMEEAVTTAQSVKAEAESIAAALKLELSGAVAKS
jgi:hypothetical protein